MRRRGGEAEQTSQRFGGAAARAQLEHLAEQHERDDHGSGFKIHGDFAARAAKGRRENARSDSGQYAVGVRCACADGDQRKHVPLARNERGPAALEKWRARPEHHGRGQNKLEPFTAAQREQAGRRCRRKKRARHGHQQKRHGGGYAEPETPGHGNQFVVGRFLGRDGARLERHSADGAASRSRGDDFGMHRAGVSSGRGACRRRGGVRGRGVRGRDGRCGRERRSMRRRGHRRRWCRADNHKRCRWGCGARREVFVGVHLEFLGAAGAAEKIGTAGMLGASGGPGGVDLHAANGVALGHAAASLFGIRATGIRIFLAVGRIPPRRLDVADSVRVSKLGVCILVILGGLQRAILGAPMPSGLTTGGKSAMSGPIGRFLGRITFSFPA